MSFKAPPQLLQKVLGFKAYTHKNGKFYLFDVPGILSPVYMKVYQQKILEKNIGQKKTQNLLYSEGRIQGHAGFKMTSERFGYAETIKDKSELLRFTTAQADLIGLGHFEWKVIDFNKKIFIISGESSLAEEYKKFFGIQKEGIDYFFRGAISAFIESVLGEKVLTIEKECIAKGNVKCVFVTKPISSWNDKEIALQKIELAPDFKQLGAKKEPYILT